MNFELDGEHKAVVAIEHMHSALLCESAKHLFTDKGEALQAVNGSFKDPDTQKRINGWFELEHEKRMSRGAKK